jgi:hypothetical protein
MNTYTYIKPQLITIDDVILNYRIMSEWQFDLSARGNHVVLKSPDYELQLYNPINVRQDGTQLPLK